MVVKQVVEELLHEAVEALFTMISSAWAIFRATAEWRMSAAVKTSNMDCIDFMIMDLSSMA
jgi:aminoglycoside N3'-acetyltransferase